MTGKSLVQTIAGFVAGTVFAQAAHDSLDWSETVGRDGTNRVVLPLNQVITPAGTQIELPRLRPQVLALSPDGKLLITSGKTRNLVIIDPDSGKISQTIELPNDALLPDADPVSSHILKPDKDEQVSYTGLVFSPDGSHLYVSNVKGSVKVFAIDKGHHLTGVGSISLPDANVPRRKEEIPSDSPFPPKASAFTWPVVCPIGCWSMNSRRENCCAPLTWEKFLTPFNWLAAKPM